MESGNIIEHHWNTVTVENMKIMGECLNGEFYPKGISDSVSPHCEKSGPVNLLQIFMLAGTWKTRKSTMVLVLSERANFYLQQRRPHIIPKAKRVDVWSGRQMKRVNNWMFSPFIKELSSYATQIQSENEVGTIVLYPRNAFPFPVKQGPFLNFSTWLSKRDTAENDGASKRDQI